MDQGLPPTGTTHFLDSSILLSPLLDNDLKDKDRKRLVLRFFRMAKEGYYRLIVSSMVIGECVTAIRRGISERIKRREAYAWLDELLDNVSEVSTPEITAHIAELNRLKSEAAWIGSTDTRIRAEAAESDADYIVTTDKKFQSDVVKQKKRVFVFS